MVRLTPPGSDCSIIIGTGLSSAAPGSVQGLHLPEWYAAHMARTLAEDGCLVSRPDAH